MSLVTLTVVLFRVVVMCLLCVCSNSDQCLYIETQFVFIMRVAEFVSSDISMTTFVVTRILIPNFIVVCIYIYTHMPICLDVCMYM